MALPGDPREGTDRDRVPDHRIHTGDIPELSASGGAIDVEGTAFLTLSGGKVTEVRTVFDTLALAVKTGAVEARAWWPGAARPKPCTLNELDDAMIQRLVSGIDGPHHIALLLATASRRPRGHRASVPVAR